MASEHFLHSLPETYSSNSHKTGTGIELEEDEEDAEESGSKEEE